MSDTWSIILIAALIFFIIMLLTGNGDKLMNGFGGRYSNTDSLYDKERMNRATLVLCIVLLVNELVLFFLGKTVEPLALISLIICILAFAVYIFYLKKFCQKR